MALLNGLSIKWKISLALIFSGLILVGAYIFIAKRVFESDKISYVFDAQSSKLDSLKREIESRLERTLLVSRGVISTFDEIRGAVSTSGEQIFKEESHLLALDLWNESTNSKILSLEKQEALFVHAPTQASNAQPGVVEVSPLGENMLLLTFRYIQPDIGSFRLRAVLDISKLLPPATPSQSFALAQNNKILSVTDFHGLEQTVFEEMLNSVSGDEADKTMMWGQGSDRYLLSTKVLKLGKLRIISTTPEAEALGALGTLFHRSMMFLVFSTFGLILVSLALARSLTSGLFLLTEAAGEIGRGNFDATPKTTSRDETGILISAFQRMAEEIKELLVKTHEKARMEEELKTASLVQERLFPRLPTSQIGEIQVSGLIRSSSECGGDWWYYFQRGNDLYVAIADATGHGTPAALITAAARSIFSRLENEPLSLTEMIMAWDAAIYSCSQSQVLMTGVILRINTVTGRGTLVCAAHEAPFLLKEEDEGFSFDEANVPISSHLGSQIKSQLHEIDFTLDPNMSMVLYTDGLFAIEKPDGKSLSKRRFGKKLVTMAEEARSANSVTDAVMKIFDDYRESQPLPDDVSVVSIRRVGSDRVAKAG